MKTVAPWLIMLAAAMPVWAQDTKPWQLFEAAERLYAEGRYEDALSQYNRCLSLDAGFYEAYPSRAAVRERLQDWSGAVIDYSIYLEKNPDHDETLLSRGLAHYHAGKFQSSIDDFHRFLTTADGRETQTLFYRQSAGGGTDQILSAQGAIKDYVLNWIGLSLFKLERYDDALAYFDSAIWLNDREPDYLVHRGLVKEKKEDWMGAERDYQAALALDPDHGLAYHNLGVMLQKRNDPVAAEAQYTQAILRNPDLSYGYLERGYYRMENGNFTGALADYDKAIECSDKDAEAWVSRGLVKEKLKDLNGALSDFSRAIQLDEDFEKAWFCRGNVFSRLGKLQEAIEDYGVAILCDASYANAYYNRAVAKHRLGDLTGACKDVSMAESLGMQQTEKLRAACCR